ncbi:B-cell receptor CD22-like [Clarias gariepinus]
MMSFRLTPPLSLLFLLMGSGVVSEDWSVIYTPKSICALKGSTVIMGCRYTYPYGYRVQRVFWSRELATDKEPPDLSQDPKYSDRVQYLGNTWGDCRLELSGVTEQDQGKYYFRFITTTARGKYQGKDGVELSVTELQVEMSPDSVVEGHDVTLTCKTTCRRTVTPTFTWYKTGHPLSFISSSNPVRLRLVSQSYAGSYSCGVRGQSYRSPAVTLDVQYPPKSVSVSISPSGEIVEGSSVSLTCSSKANPPAEYTWFKGTLFKTKGNIHTIENISSEDSGEYKCKSMNQYGAKYSDNVTVNVLYPPKNVSVSISPSGEIVGGSSVTLTCSSDANPPVELYTWYKVNESSPVGSGQSYSFTLSFSSSGWFYCVAQNKHGTQRAAAVPLILNGDSRVVLYVVLGVMAGCGCLFVIIGVLYIRRKRSRAFEDEKSNQENTYSSVNPTNNPAPDPDQVPQDDVQYAVIQHQSDPRRAAGQTAGSEATEEVQYASVQHQRDIMVERNQDDYDQYSNVRFNHTRAAYRSAAPAFEDTSVIYSN